MALNIMIQGTMSNVGKSIITTGLCRILKQDGYKVAPFKSQNMALNSFITEDGGEMGRAQVAQAQACGIKPDVRMNPILLKPTSDCTSQVIINGKAIGNLSASDYFKNKTNYIPQILDAYKSLDNDFDIIVIEGAGSPAELNLKQNDIVNMGFAELVDAPVLLVGDVDRGGVFAQLYGTIALLDENERARIKGILANKFRGDIKIFDSGIKILEDICQKPVVGVIPYSYSKIDDEDSLTEKFASKAVKSIDIAVIRFPKISNFTDFNVFEQYENVSVRYVDNISDFKNPDMIILPGTKSTIEDFKWLRQSGLESLILKAVERDTLIFGICGGFQMMGTKINDNAIESKENTSISGMNILPITTEFKKNKVQRQTEGVFKNIEGILKCLNGISYSGYEIHMGISDCGPVVIQNGNVYGSYIHGIFDGQNIAYSILKALCARKGLSTELLHKFDIKAYNDKQYDILADDIRKGLDMKTLYKIINRQI